MGDKDRSLFFLTQDSADIITYAESGLDKFRSAHPSELSGGMRQRAALIRTLALKPELLLLDEPFSALDSQTRLSVSDDIGRILRQEKKTAILVTHDISEAISMADRVIILSPRPAIIRKIVPICFDLENRTPMASRNAPEFKSYFNLIWKELNHDFPQHQKEKKNKYPQKKNKFLFSFLMSDILLLMI